MSVTITGVGHAALTVRDLAVSVPFYRDVLGMHEVARRDFGEGPTAFLSTGHSHHDLALVEIGSNAGTATDAVGLHHLAFRIGADLGALRAAKSYFDDQGIEVRWILDHVVSQGLYLADPDGHLLELYVDADPTLWRTTPSLVANSEPLKL